MIDAAVDEPLAWYRLHLFGRFHLEAGQRPLTLPTHKVEGLLAYLALHPQAHSRDELATCSGVISPTPRRALPSATP